MKSLLRKWSMGASYLFADDLISFYAFFTIIFAECAYLHARYDDDIALAFTVILLGYVVDVVVCAWAKGLCEGKMGKLLVAICYVMIAIAMFVIGCLIDPKMNVILFAVPTVSTAVCIAIRYYGDSFSMPEAVRSLLQSATVGIPWLTFAITVALIPRLPIYGKVLITAAYAICAPFIAYFEDNTASQNIFELACVDW